jgi:hypothetical protein
MGLLNSFFVAANDGEAEALAAELGGPGVSRPWHD